MCDNIDEEVFALSRYNFFTGDQREVIYLENGGGTYDPCAYDSSVPSSLCYTYKGHFALVLEDYNGIWTYTEFYVR